MPTLNYQSVEKFFETYKDQDEKSYAEASCLELIGAELVGSFNSSGTVDSEKALDFINRVETWKAMGIPERIFGVGITKEAQAEEAVRNSIKATSIKEQITSFHTLRGFGISIDSDYKTRKAKVASAAVRFLFPKQWGVVDWRSGSVSECMLRAGFDLDRTMELFKSVEMYNWKMLYEHIDADRAIELNDRYAKIGKYFRISKNADVDIFLFGISLEVCPITNKKPGNLKYGDCMKNNKPICGK